MEDMERLRQRQPPASSTSRQSPTPSTSQPTSSDSPFSAVKETVDKVLIADFFFILFALAWLGAGVVANTAF